MRAIHDRKAHWNHHEDVDFDDYRCINWPMFPVHRGPKILPQKGPPKISHLRSIRPIAVLVTPLALSSAAEQWNLNKPIPTA